MNIKSAQYKTDTNPITKKTENSHIELIYEMEKNGKYH